jgi:hypothetical protein
MILDLCKLDSSCWGTPPRPSCRWRSLNQTLTHSPFFALRGPATRAFADTCQGIGISAFPFPVALPLPLAADAVSPFPSLEFENATPACSYRRPKVGVLESRHPPSRALQHTTRSRQSARVTAGCHYCSAAKISCSAAASSVAALALGSTSSLLMCAPTICSAVLYHLALDT